MIDEKLSHYRVVEQIGSGGMGVVFRAHDEQLDRDVALKVLRPGTITDPGARARFRKEALALAKLDHPNIATIFEFGSQEDVDFLVTAYVPGITLDAKLGSRPLPPAEVISLGIQLAKGLAAAHTKGVVHRDLKPGNLRLAPDGLLKILDFGLARFVETGSEAETLTRTKEFSGTIPYMSPEQVKGEPVDVRTDIWSAGVVLYELATGARPFQEKHSATLINDILNTQPRTPRYVNPDVPTGLENVILQALSKDPARRYQTATELGSDLERLQAGLAPKAKSQKRFRWRASAALVATVLLVISVMGALLWRRRIEERSTKARRSVAVLGFKNLAANKADAWISPALSEMLTTELGAGGKLRTIAGENVSRMKIDFSLPDSDTLGNETLAKIHRVLGSDLVVTGSYLALDGQIRVDLRVQDFSGEHIATVSDQGSQAQFFELIKRVGEKLRQECGSGEVIPQELEATRASEPSSTEAVRFYTEGLEKLRQFDALAARDLLQRAVAVDPNYALAHSALSAAWTQLGYDTKALDESKKALDTSTQLPRADKLSIQARHYESNHEFDKAVEVYRSLWTFFPDDLDYGLRLATAQVSASKGQDALATVQNLRQLTAPSRDDPRIDLVEATASESLADFKRAETAIARARDKADRQGSPFMMAQALMEDCWAERNLGDLGAALSSGEQARSILSAAKDGRGEARSLTCIANALADQGKLADARNMHEQALTLARKLGAQKDIAGALINLGNLAASENLQGSTAYYQEALVVANQVGDKLDALSAQNNMAINFVAEGKFPDATSMLQSALQSARDLADESSIVVAQINLGNLSLSLGNFADSRKYFAAAMSRSEQLSLKSNMAAALTGMGDLALAEDDLASAEQNYQRSLSIRTQIGEQTGVATSQLSLATLNFEKGRPKAAADLARQAAEEFQKEHTEDQEAAARALFMLAAIAQSDASAAYNEHATIQKLRVQDRALQLTVGIADAKYLAATANGGEAIHRLKDLAARARRLGLQSSQFEADLARLELETKAGVVTAREQLKHLQKESEARGFRLVARKARTFLDVASNKKASAAALALTQIIASLECNVGNSNGQMWILSDNYKES